jgi:dipeptidyl aminopeptidase/acylaminoacyl peptidase
MVEPELIEYLTFDGKMIPALLYKPKIKAGKQYPVVVSVHGGPEWQERARYNYNGLYQYLLNQGIAILAPNIRGSTGYGLSYQKLIRRDWGGGELKDIEYAARYLHSLDWADNDRIAIFGASFGGQTVLGAVSRLPEYWVAGVSLVAAVSLVTFIKNCPEHWKPMMKGWVGDLEEDYDMLVERSPSTYVDNIRAPLLMIYGANDPRNTADSTPFVERVRENGIEVQYYIDETGGHRASNRNKLIKWWKMVADFLEDKLLNGEH